MLVGQPVIDDDAAIDGEAGRSRERDIGADAGGQNDHVGGDVRPSFSSIAFDCALAVDRAVSAFEPHVDALVLAPAASAAPPPAHRAGAPSAVHQMDQRHRRAGLGEAIGRFKPEQTAADHDRALLRCRPASAAVDVAAVAEGDDAGETRARNVQPHRLRAGGEDELRERDRRPSRQDDAPALQVDRGRRACRSVSVTPRSRHQAAGCSSISCGRSRRRAPRTAARGYRRAAARRR